MLSFLRHPSPRATFKIFNRQSGLRMACQQGGKKPGGLARAAARKHTSSHHSSAEPFSAWLLSLLLLAPLCIQGPNSRPSGLLLTSATIGTIAVIILHPNANIIIFTFLEGPFTPSPVSASSSPPCLQNHRRLRDSRQ